MITLITGGSASGKSIFAEECLLNTGMTTRLYMATMIPWDEESQQRIEKHQNMRLQKGFQTVELHTGLGNWSLTETDISASAGQSAILLECISNLAANEQYLVGGTANEICVRIIDGIKHLQKEVRHLIIVTNEVFSDGIQYGEETRSYLKILGDINRILGNMADEVIEVVYGIPVQVKHKG